MFSTSLHTVAFTIVIDWLIWELSAGLLQFQSKVEACCSSAICNRCIWYFTIQVLFLVLFASTIEDVCQLCYFMRMNIWLASHFVSIIGTKHLLIETEANIKPSKVFRHYWPRLQVILRPHVISFMINSIPLIYYQGQLQCFLW